jgi:hypothetical protein
VFTLFSFFSSPIHRHTIKIGCSRVPSRAACMYMLQVFPVTPVWSIAVTLLLGGG